MDKVDLEGVVDNILTVVEEEIASYAWEFLRHKYGDAYVDMNLDVEVEEVKAQIRSALKDSGV